MPRRDAQVKGGVENKMGKVNVLLQAYISRARVDSFSLTADLSYISQSAGRIFRALFELCLRRGWCSMADTLLAYCIAVERRLWPHASPLRQACDPPTPDDPTPPYSIFGSVADVKLSSAARRGHGSPGMASKAHMNRWARGQHPSGVCSCSGLP